MSRFHVALSLALTVVFCQSGAGATPRAWTSYDGKKKVTGTLVRFEQVSVEFRKRLGQWAMDGVLQQHLTGEKKELAERLAAEIERKDPHQQLRGSAGKVVTYAVVVLKVEGAERQIPMCLFSEADQKRLTGPYDNWCAAQKAADERAMAARSTNSVPGGELLGPRCPVCGQRGTAWETKTVEGNQVQKVTCPFGHTSYMAVQ